MSDGDESNASMGSDSSSDSSDDFPMICTGLASAVPSHDTAPKLKISQLYDWMIFGVPLQLLRIIMLCHCTVEAWSMCYSF